jgi:hypothetical protein
MPSPDGNFTGLVFWNHAGFDYIQGPLLLAIFLTCTGRLPPHDT